MINENIMVIKKIIKLFILINSKTKEIVPITDDKKTFLNLVILFKIIDVDINTI